MSQTLAMSLEINTSNIVEGSRRRKRTRRLVDSAQWQKDYGRLILDDVPQDELVAALIADVSEDPEIESEDEGCVEGSVDTEMGFVVQSSDQESEDDDDYITVSDGDEDEETDDEETDDETGAVACNEREHDTVDGED
jgi:hypothetical protein